MWGCGLESDETSMVVLLLGLDFEFDLNNGMQAYYAVKYKLHFY